MKPEKALLSSVILLSNSSPAHYNIFERGLSLRTNCGLAEKVCGIGCIPLSSNCCPDGSGGCTVGDKCVIGDNGKYGCCPSWKVCDGDGGVTTSGTRTYTSTYTDYSSPTSSLSSGSLCSSNNKPCGSVCIPLSYTCCPDKTGGCSSDRYCNLRSDGSYGCCPNGVYCGADDNSIATSNRHHSTSINPADYPLSWHSHTWTDYYGHVATESSALYEGGYVTNSDQYSWSTWTHTNWDGALITETYASCPSDGCNGERAATSTSRAGGRGGTGAEAVSEGANTISRPHEGFRSMMLLTYSTIAAGTMFIAMMWL